MKRLLSTRRPFLLVTTLMLAMQFLPSVMAQEVVAPVRKFDSFEGLFSSCDYGGRLDNLAIELQNNRSADGYIICYGPENGPGGANYRLRYTQDYLVNTRGIDGTRIKTLYGGRYKELKAVFTELWIVPPGATSPEPITFEVNAKAFTGMFDEYLFWEGTAEGDGMQGDLTLTSFADVLTQQSDTRAYIVVQNRKEGAPGAWRRAARDVSTSLQVVHGIEVERIKVIYAGSTAKVDDFSGGANVQLWILPRDAPPPVVEAKSPEPSPEKAVRWRSFGVYELEDASDKRDIFDALAEVLRHDKDLSVCMIVHQQSAPQHNPELSTEDDKQARESTSAKFKLPDVDLMKVVEVWQSDLAKDYGISQQRLTIISAESEDWSYGMLEIWFVPTGASLPDPNAENIAEPEGDSEQDNVQQDSPQVEPIDWMQ